MTVRKPMRIKRRLQRMDSGLRALRKDLGAALALKATNAQQCATIARLIGENDRLRERCDRYKRYINQKFGSTVLPVTQESTDGSPIHRVQ